MKLLVYPRIKRLAIQGCISIALLCAVSTEGISQPIGDVISETISFLVRDWANDEDYNEWRPPQVMAIPASTKIYGACGIWLEGSHVAEIGSYLVSLSADFGDWSPKKQAQARVGVVVPVIRDPTLSER